MHLNKQIFSKPPIVGGWVKWATLEKTSEQGIGYSCYEGFVYIDSSKTFTEARHGKARRKQKKRRGERRCTEI
jgi:hypothetical protein